MAYNPLVHGNPLTIRDLLAKICAEEGHQISRGAYRVPLNDCVFYFRIEFSNLYPDAIRQMISNMVLSGTLESELVFGEWRIIIPVNERKIK
ncbi:MAG: hypothetical protein V1661_02735 [bacterium]